MSFRHGFEFRIFDKTYAISPFLVFLCIQFTTVAERLSRTSCSKKVFAPGANVRLANIFKSDEGLQYDKNGK
jgi:hypothetical protein